VRLPGVGTSLDLFSLLWANHLTLRACRWHKCTLLEKRVLQLFKPRGVVELHIFATLRGSTGLFHVPKTFEGACNSEKPLKNPWGVAYMYTCSITTQGFRETGKPFFYECKCPSKIQKMHFPQKIESKILWYHQKVLLKSFPMNDHVGFNNLLFFCVTHQS
jgi:hypothetical protein